MPVSFILVKTTYLKAQSKISTGRGSSSHKRIGGSPHGNADISVNGFEPKSEKEQNLPSVPSGSLATLKGIFRMDRTRQSRLLSSFRTKNDTMISTIDESEDSYHQHIRTVGNV